MKTQKILLLSLVVFFVMFALRTVSFAQTSGSKEPWDVAPSTFSDDVVLSIDRVKELFGIQQDDVVTYFTRIRALAAKRHLKEQLLKFLDRTKSDLYERERFIPSPDWQRVLYKGDDPQTIEIKFLDRGGMQVRFIDGKFQDLALVSNGDACQLKEKLSVSEMNFLEQRNFSCETRKALLERINVWTESLLREGGHIQTLYRGKGDENREERLSKLRDRAREKSHREQPDLLSAFRVTLPEAWAPRALDICRTLLALGQIVEYCTPLPQLTLPTEDAKNTLSKTDLKTPDYSVQQNYLLPAPDGMDVLYAWQLPGGRGEGIQIIDVERSWNIAHEDFPVLIVESFQTEKDADHGTAVLGLICGKDNGFGVQGIANQASCGVVSFASDDVLFVGGIADALLVAVEHLDEGDVLLIEVQARGPTSDTSCSCNCDQFEQIPIEFWQSSYDIIQMANDIGIIVVEAAGNGSMNLDSDVYLGLFQRSLRDSGAIFVGAGDAKQHVPLCWTNFGSRVDMQAWGEGVITTGYGDLFGDEASQYYTSNFQGTSSASALVAGVATVLQGVFHSKTGNVLSPQELREILVSSGTQEGQGDVEKHIGPLPDLRKAITALEAKAARSEISSASRSLGETSKKKTSFIFPIIIFLFSAILVIVLGGIFLLRYSSPALKKRR